MALTPCSHCARHLHTHETLCPFCERGAPTTAPRPVRLASLTRATVFYLGATVAACGEPSASPRASEAPVTAAPVIAAPPPSVAPVPVVAPPTTGVAEAPPVVAPATHVRRPDSTSTPLAQIAQLADPVGPLIGSEEGPPLPGGQGYGAPPFFHPELGYPSHEDRGVEVVLRGRADLGTATVSDDAVITSSDASRMIATRRSAMRACYERELRANPMLAGRLVVSFAVGAGGTTSAARIDESTIGSDAISACVLRVVGSIHFGSAPDDEIRVQIPITFSSEATSSE